MAATVLSIVVPLMEGVRSPSSSAHREISRFHACVGADWHVLCSCSIDHAGMPEMLWEEERGDDGSSDWFCRGSCLQDQSTQPEHA